MKRRLKTRSRTEGTPKIFSKWQSKQRERRQPSAFCLRIGLLETRKDNLPGELANHEPNEDAGHVLASSAPIPRDTSS